MVLSSDTNRFFVINCYLFNEVAPIKGGSHD